ncbi:MAG: tetratricopeptide repeat protein [Candidatus Sumerlaeota bacterium]|nr:tetratricopeptide repeat protein [Candidatus Sumerlaeota bacterium]
MQTLSRFLVVGWLALGAWAFGAAPAKEDASSSPTLSSLMDFGKWLTGELTAPLERELGERLGQGAGSTDLERLLAKAHDMDARGDLENLESTAWLIRNSHPESPWGPYYLGRVNLSRGRFRQALGFFRQGLATAKHGDEAATGCYFGTFDSLFVLGEFDGAEALAARYPPKHPDEPQFAERRLLLEVAEAARGGELAPMMLTLSSDRVATPTVWLWEPLLEQTVQKLAAGNREEEAEAIAQLFVQRFPRSPAAWNSLALARWALGRYAEGFEAFRRAERLAPRPSPAWGPRYTLAGNVATKIENVDLQIEYYEKALRAGAGTALVLNNLAWSYYQKGVRTDFALQLAQEAVRIRPDDAPSLDTLARLQARSGQKAAAVDSINRAIERSLFDPYVEDMKSFRRELAPEGAGKEEE